MRPPSLFSSSAAASRPSSASVLTSTVLFPTSKISCPAASRHPTCAQPRFVGCYCGANTPAAPSAGHAPTGVTPPARDYDFRAATATASAQTASEHPELRDLVEDGTLVVVRRPPDYVERRSDGYMEPEVVYLVGTAHMSSLSATQVHEFPIPLTSPTSWPLLVIVLKSLHSELS